MTVRGSCLQPDGIDCSTACVSKMWVQTCRGSVAGCKHYVACVCARLWSSLAGMGGSCARVIVGAGGPGNWLCCC